MSIRSKWLIILVGNNDTGKTTLQKKLIKLLSDDNRDIKLKCNLPFDITHPYIIRKLRTFSIGNRSVQEKLAEYGSVRGYFRNHFHEADLCIVSSHLVAKDITEMIAEGHKRFYNVCGLFFSNSIAKDPGSNSKVSALLWDERVVAENAQTRDKAQWDKQLRQIAETIVQTFVERSHSW